MGCGCSSTAPVSDREAAGRRSPSHGSNGHRVRAGSGPARRSSSSNVLGINRRASESESLNSEDRMAMMREQQARIDSILAQLMFQEQLQQLQQMSDDQDGDIAVAARSVHLTDGLTQDEIEKVGQLRELQPFMFVEGSDTASSVDGTALRAVTKGETTTTGDETATPGGGEVLVSMGDPAEDPSGGPHGRGGIPKPPSLHRSQQHYSSSGSLTGRHASNHAMQTAPNSPLNASQTSSVTSHFSSSSKDGKTLAELLLKSHHPSAAKHFTRSVGFGSGNECIMCLGEYAVHDRVRVLDCKHFYHAECIDAWLRKKRTCPCCCVDVVRNNQADSGRGRGVYGQSVGSQEASSLGN